MIIVLYPTQYDSPDKRGRGCQLLINSSEQKRVLLNKEEDISSFNDSYFIRDYQMFHSIHTSDIKSPGIDSLKLVDQVFRQLVSIGRI